MDDSQLIERAQSVLHLRQLTDECIAGEVAAAALTSQGTIYTGVSISAGCGIGFCAEHSAIAAMVTAGETHIQKLVAIAADGKLMPPCGRCRELLYQIDRGNLEAEIILELGRPTRLSELLPHRWQDLWAPSE